MEKFRSLGHEEAHRAVEAISGELVRRGKAAVIAVAGVHGETVMMLRLDGAPWSSVQIAANKAWTAARERRPSGEIGEASRDSRGGFDISSYGDPRYVGWAGGLPVVLEGAVVGAVAVSGLTEEEDAELAGVGVAAITQA
jgi:glc operon protein GlcG